MEITKTLTISADEFYTQLMNSVIFDIRKQTGKTLTRKQLRKFEYIKEYSKNSRAKIVIEEAVENKTYQFRTSTTKNDFSVRYELQPMDEKSCELRYTETMVSYGALQKLNDAVLGIFLSYFKKKQFYKMLKMMETA